MGSYQASEDLIKMASSSSATASRTVQNDVWNMFEIHSVMSEQDCQLKVHLRENPQLEVRALDGVEGGGADSVEWVELRS